MEKEAYEGQVDTKVSWLGQHDVERLYQVSLSPRVCVPHMDL
jgi:hypothetical protein